MSLYSYFAPETRRQALLILATTISTALLLVVAFILLFGTSPINIEGSIADLLPTLIGYTFIALFALTIYFLVEIVLFSIRSAKDVQGKDIGSSHEPDTPESLSPHLQRISYDPSQQLGAVKTLSPSYKNGIALVGIVLFVVFIVLLAQGKVIKEAASILIPFISIGLVLLFRAKGANQTGTPQLRKQEFALRNNFSYSAPSAAGSQRGGERDLGTVSGELNARSFTIQFTRFKKPFERYIYEYAYCTPC